MLIAAWCAVAMQAEYREGYYDGMDGTAKEELKSAAKQCVAQHTRLVYKELPNYWIDSDTYPVLFDGRLRWWDMYSDNMYLIEEWQTGTQAFSANKMQREHAVPKSWWKKDGDVEYTPAYTDMWNLYPSDGPANQAKLNYPLGPVGSADFDNGVTRVGAALPGYGGGSGKVFEPADEYKGDFARAFFYMATVYDDLPWKYTYMFESNVWPTLTPWAMDMLLEWSRRDPVSTKETERNDAVEKCQGNRNPYVDFPMLAEYVWGELTDAVFALEDQKGGVSRPGIEQLPAELKVSDGRITVLGDRRTAGFIVTDICGRVLLKVDQACGGDSFYLPVRGVVIITSGGKSKKFVL